MSDSNCFSCFKPNKNKESDDPIGIEDATKKSHSYKDEHQISISDLVNRLESDLKTGLFESVAKERLEQYGLNQLKEPPQTPEWLKFLKIMVGGFAGLLWIAAILCFIAVAIDGGDNLDNAYIGGALIVVVIVTGLFTYYQENKSSQIIKSFGKMVPPKALVVREGKIYEIDATHLVIGDIVIISFGDRTPADLRIISSEMLKVDNSSLTGESVPVSLKPGDSTDDVLESKNLGFYSTNIVEGKGTGIVIKTGNDTIMGGVANLVATTKPPQTPINEEISRFVRLITAIAISIGIIFFIIAMVMGYEWMKAIVFVIGIIVANVPEGLLITVTITLTLTAQKMLTKNCVVKNLEGVETLGSTSVICSDKTGTLTQNKMTVASMYFNRSLVLIECDKTIYGKGFDKTAEGWSELSTVAALCSNAEFMPAEENMRKHVNDRLVSGDATEAGILKCHEILMGDTYEYRSKCPSVICIPFNSKEKYQASVHKMPTGQYRIVIKGAPEVIFKRCSTALVNGKDIPIENVIRRITKASTKMARKGQRVLAFADKDLSQSKFPNSYKFEVVEGNPNFPLQDLRFVGLMGLIDPPKATVPHAVNQCRSAGIKVVMVTGDHPVTAVAISKDVGIITTKPIMYQDDTLIPTESQAAPSGCIPGYVMVNWTEDQLDQIIACHNELVFARTSPEQKLLIVESFQRAGYIVAVTGDGVNDSPALKKADIGVAMGISGSEVSKEAADMILLDDDFATIVNGVEEGRLIFDNLKKSIVYTLTSNIPEILPFLSWVVLRIPLPLSTLAILAVDLCTDMVPAISLAYEKAELDIMQRPPRSVSDRLVNHRLIYLAYALIGVTQGFAGFFIYFTVMVSYGWMPWDLIGINNRGWEDKNNNALVDSWGQEWTYSQRMVLEKTCNTAYFLAIVQVQWADVIISKTRVLSIVEQGMTNWVLNGGMIFETICATFLIYFPYTFVLGFYPLSIEWWIPALPFAVLIFVIDEVRRYFIRKALRTETAIGDFLTMETYY